MKRKRRRTQVIVRMLEYEIYGRQVWWPESLSKEESEEVTKTLHASGCQVMVHEIKMTDVNQFVEPMELPCGATRSKVGSQKPSDSN